MNRKVSFKDKENNLATIEIEITDNRLSMCGEYRGGGGQCLDSIKPKNKEQERLIEIWRRWHLNDMHAGTEKQEAAIDKWIKKGNHYDYEKACKYLKSIRLFVDHSYKYGHGWLKRNLPNELEQEIITLCNKIASIEEAEKEQLRWRDSNIDDDRIIALAKYLFLEPYEAKEYITGDDERYSYSGQDYLVLTDSEADAKCREDLVDNDELWKQAVQHGDTTLGLEEWADQVISVDGRGSILNRYDGDEGEEEVNGTWYFIYRD